MLFDLTTMINTEMFKSITYFLKILFCSWFMFKKRRYKIHFFCCFIQTYLNYNINVIICKRTLLSTGFCNHNALRKFFPIWYLTNGADPHTRSVQYIKNTLGWEILYREIGSYYPCKCISCYYSLFGYHHNTQNYQYR